MVKRKEDGSDCNSPSSTSHCGDGLVFSELYHGGVEVTAAVVVTLVSSPIVTVFVKSK